MTPVFLVILPLKIYKKKKSVTPLPVEYCLTFA